MIVLGITRMLEKKTSMKLGSTKEERERKMLFEKGGEREEKEMCFSDTKLIYAH